MKFVTEKFESPVLRLLLKYQSTKVVAEKLGKGVTNQMVRYWVREDFIPVEYWRDVLKLMDVTVEELLDHAEWRAATRRVTKDQGVTTGC